MDSVLDNWGEWNRECTSYAAWMLHSVNGFEMPFHDNAVNWGPDATSRHIPVNMAPAPGAIFWTSSPQHVAWVKSVNNDGSVTIEDYNSDYAGHWNERNVAASSASGYIHFKDLTVTPPADLPGSSVTLNVNGQLQLFYYDASGGNLRHTFSDANGWHFENLDGDTGSIGHIGDNVGQYVSAAVIGTQTQLFYYDATRHVLRHAWKDTSGWHFEDLDGTSGSISGHVGDVGQYIDALNVNGQLQLFYYDASGGNLRHAFSDANGWHFENLDGDTGSIGHIGDNVGQYVSAAVIGTQIQLFYYDATRHVLRHVWTNPGWSFEDLDGTSGSVSRHTGDVGQYNDALNVNGQLQLFYYDASGGNLRHAFSDANGWHFENLDGDTGSIGHIGDNVGRYPSAVAVGTQVQLFYYDATNGLLRHAWSDTSGWHFEGLDGGTGTVAASGFRVGQLASTVTVNGQIQLYYYDATNRALRHAWTSPGWSFETLDGTTGSVSGHVADVR